MFGKYYINVISNFSQKSVNNFLPLLLAKIGAVPLQKFRRYLDFKNATFEKSSGEKRYLATVLKYRKKRST